MTLTFRKRERMVSQRLIDDLFAGGSSHSVAAFPLRAVYKLRERNDHEVPLRNRVKRQVREAWRRHKSLLVEAVASDKQLLVAFVWLSDSMLSTQDVEERVAGIVKRLQERL